MGIIEEIMTLKKEKNALILAHFYQVDEIQEVADFVGDSLALARYAAETACDRIVVCGVKFMAESAKILSPDKMVLIPRMDAGCPMADMVTEEALITYKTANPERYVVSYVNTSAAVKAHTDICVTSSNAQKIISQLDAEKIVFLPDKNLGGYIKKQFPEKDIDLWRGFCLTHHSLEAEAVKNMKHQHTDALVLAHPECNEEVLQLADYIGSTKGIIEYAKESKAQSFIIATEKGVMHSLEANNPDKSFYLADACLECRNMKKTTINDLLNCLKYDQEVVALSQEIIDKAKKSLDTMLLLS